MVKTIKDITAEMRRYADQLDMDGDITGADFRDFADKIDAVFAPIQYDMTKMRKALECIRDMAVAGVHDGSVDCYDIISASEAALDAVNIANEKPIADFVEVNNG